MVNCFIAMPISTLDPSVYSNDADHFGHVLNYLFIPALKIAGFNPIPPVAEGADIIHAEIIKNIEQADLVLCDISSLNPNVFFELGIRTAVNKPVCVVKDDVTPRIPFDTTIINHHTYLSSLNPWTLERQIEDLAKHINKSNERSGGKNSLWRYFGLSTRASLPESKANGDERLSLLSLQIENLSRQLEQDYVNPISKGRTEDPGDVLFHQLVSVASASGATVSSGGWGSRKMKITVDSPLDGKTAHDMLTIASRSGFHLTIETKKTDS